MTQFFFIKSRLSGYVMDVEGGNRDAGAHVILWEKKDHSIDNTNQLFYEDNNNRCIRSALNDLCLSMNADNELVLNHYNNSSVQRWQRDGDRIRNCDDSQVLDVSGESTDQGAKMCKWDDHGGINQQFDFEYVEPRYFYIKSALNGKVLDVSGADRGEGAEVIMWDQNEEESENQLWFVAGDGNIRSKLNGFTLDCRDGDLKLFPVEEYNTNQGFQMSGDHITSRHDGRCADISGANTDDGAHCCAWEQHDGENQRWEFHHI